jgi:chromosome segregation ATPase
MVWTPYSNLTDEELICGYRVSSDPIVRELANRLATAIDEPQAEIAELKEAVEELENATCDECETREAEMLRLEDDYEDRIAKLDEQIAHECERIKEFHDENQQFIAEINRLQSELQWAQQPATRKDRIMIEEKMDGLGTKIGTLEDELVKTNMLLGELISLIKDGGSVPPVPAKATRAKSAKGKAKVKAVANDDADKTPARKAAKAADPINIEDVREALIAVRDNHSREAAVAIAEQFSGGTRKVRDIPEDKYPEVLAACDAVHQGEAA